MATKAKRRKMVKLDETETVLLSDDLKQVRTILLDFKGVKKADVMESKVKKCPRLGVTLMNVLWKCCIQNFDDQPQWMQILNDVLCVLTNICGSVPAVSYEIAETPGNFANVAVRLLESGPKVTLKAKCEMFRLICYVAKDPRCMELITANTHLVDRIAMAVDHEANDVAKLALKTAQVLAVSRNGIKGQDRFRSN